MKLDSAQRERVSENLKLVHKVIHDKVHDPNHVGIYTYDDLVQIGCIGLCKAAVTDKGGVFSTYAYRLIWNEICSALEYASLRASREAPTEDSFLVLTEGVADGPEWEYPDLQSLLEQAEERTSGVTAKGIQALRLKTRGYTSREIGAMMGAPANHVTAWIAKARNYLRADPSFRELLSVG